MIAEHEVDLTIFGADLPVARITDVIGVDPTDAFDRGMRDPVRDLPRASLWSRATSADARDIGDHMREVIDPSCGRERRVVMDRTLRLR